MQTVWQSRKFWAAIFMLAAVLVSVFLPAAGEKFEARVEDLAAGALVIVSFMVGVAVDPGGGWNGLLRSRKFWGAIIGFVVIALDVFGKSLPFDMNPEQVITACVTISGYILAVAFERKTLDTSAVSGLLGWPVDEAPRSAALEKNHRAK